MKKLYLDNAATSFPKPAVVAEGMVNYINNIGGNVGRGTYKSSYTAGQVVYETRNLLADLFNYSNPLNVVFTMNITQSLNTILKGLLKKGDHVIVSSMEHNAVMRPLSTLAFNGVEIDRAYCSSKGVLNPDDVKKLIKQNTKCIIMTHASNVCGTILPIKEIGDICRKNNIYFILDSAQSAGVLEVDFEKFNLSALAFTGHKSLLGPQGIGGFILSEALAKDITPLIEGGTGSLSESELQPNYMPDKFESGTMNLPCIYGLNASIKYINSIGIKTIHDIEMELTKRFLEGLNTIRGIDTLGTKSIYDSTAVVSVNFKEFDNSEIAFKLDNEFGIMTRVGLHCAPSAHKTLGTFESGTVRFSFSHFNTKEDIDYTLSSINKILKSY